jgi:hypothetical protein
VSCTNWMLGDWSVLGSSAVKAFSKSAETAGFPTIKVRNNMGITSSLRAGTANIEIRKRFINLSPEHPHKIRCAGVFLDLKGANPATLIVTITSISYKVMIQHMTFDFFIIVTVMIWLFIIFHSAPVLCLWSYRSTVVAFKLVNNNRVARYGECRLSQLRISDPRRTTRTGCIRCISNKCCCVVRRCAGDIPTPGLVISKIFTPPTYINT